MAAAPTPRERGFRLPAEWEPQEAVWFSWPCNPETWPRPIYEAMLPAYAQMVALVSQGQQVYINVIGPEMVDDSKRLLEQHGAYMANVTCYLHRTNDSWTRDHGPDFLLSKDGKDCLVLDWQYNAWGGKYPPYDDDNKIPGHIAKALGLECRTIKQILEGGSFEPNGEGVLLTTKQCLLHPNRNPKMSQVQIEMSLKDNLCVDEIWWLEEGVVGDDTDGHVDDIARFVGPKRILHMVETNPADENYEALRRNAELLKTFRFADGSAPELVEVPLPAPVYHEGDRLPGSYANFLIANQVVIVPIFNDPNDKLALDLIQDCFPDRDVVGLDARSVVYGLGAFHCLSKHQPATRPSATPR